MAMPQVIVGLFSSYRDGHEALRALQLLGLGRDDGHLYQPGQRDADSGCMENAIPSEVELHAPDNAEYVAHGEHQGVLGAANRYYGSGIGSSVSVPKDIAPPSNDALARTLLLVNETPAIKLSIASGVLYEHGAVAVKDPAGHWRFSPYRRICRSQE
jgi:hypothetical protein